VGYHVTFFRGSAWGTPVKSLALLGCCYHGLAHVPGEPPSPSADVAFWLLRVLARLEVRTNFGFWGVLHIRIEESGRLSIPNVSSYQIHHQKNLSNSPTRYALPWMSLVEEFKLGSKNYRKVLFHS
jgi:hypothetical protein